MTEQITVTLPPAHEAKVSGTYSHMTGYDEYEWPGGLCGSCGKPFDDGDAVREVQQKWRHEVCAVKAISEMQIDDAWLALADAVIARPSRFKASDIRAVMQNVARLARRGAA